MAKKEKKIMPVSGNKVAKVPVVMQLEALECGAASLTMILGYYQKWIPLDKVRTDCGVSRDGSNAKNIMKAARSYGLETKAYRLEPQVLKENGEFPCIIHWNFNHFVVLDGFKKDKAILNDPARGIVEVSMETFDESFTGVCLFFEPGENFVADGKPKSILQFAAKRLQGTGSAFVFIVITSVISSLMSIIAPGFSRVFVDRLLSGVNPDWGIPFLIGLAGISAIQIIMAWVDSVYTLRINGKMAVVGSTSFMWKVLRLPMEFFSQRYAGDIQNKHSTNEAIAGQLVNTFAPLLLQAGMAIFYLVVMVRFSLLLSLVGMSSIAINVYVSRLISQKRMNIVRVMMKDSGKLASATVSGIEMVETIKASGAENGFFKKWAGYQAAVNAQTVNMTRINDRYGMIPGIVSSIANTIIQMLAVYLIMNGKFTVGMLTAFQSYMSSFSAPAQTFLGAGQTLMEMRTQMEQVEDVMEYPEDPALAGEAVETDSYEKLSGHIELKNITFGYARLSDPLIKDFSMTLEPGSRVAFVGSSGCGKSTLSKLISGLYQPWSGEILYDGKPLKDINRSVFTGSLAVVDQEIILFEDTIANNIKMWDNSIEDFEMIMAARDAQIHEDIIQRDGGYQHKLIEGGKNFSGGQRQRLELARVLAQDPTIIILDEATSALDARTEYNVVKAIKDRGITCIIVAHRLSTIRDCDEIIVLDHGNVVERGTHQELYAKGGMYTELVSNE